MLAYEAYIHTGEPKENIAGNQINFSHLMHEEMAAQRGYVTRWRCHSLPRQSELGLRVYSLIGHTAESQLPLCNREDLLHVGTAGLEFSPAFV